MGDKWRISGQYLENCNCEVLCPCLLGPRNAQGGALARPTEGHCDVPAVWQIGTGEYGRVRVDGTHVAMIVYTPGPMGENWTAGLYLDERATSEQRHALEDIFTGRAGGVVAVLSPLIKTWLPSRIVAIEFGREGRRRWARIPGVLDVEIEGIEGQSQSEVWIDNVRHFASARLAVAKATRSFYRDHGFTWNNTGRNAHYTSFEWSGP